MVVISNMADGDSMGAMSSSQIFAEGRERVLGTHQDNEKDNVVGVDDGIGGLNQNDIGSLQISVVEGRNFEATGDGNTFRPSVELQIGDYKVRTDTLKDTLSPSWLADFNLAVPSEDSQLWVSVINSDLLLDYESLVGRAAIPVNDLLCTGTRVQWIQMKDPSDNNVGEICLVLRYATHQAPFSSTAASTSSEIRDDNQYGLKALLCQCPPHSSSSSLKRISDDANNIAHGSLPRSTTQEVLEEDKDEALLPVSALIEDMLPTGSATLGSPVLQMNSFFEESDESQEGACSSISKVKREDCGGSQPCNGQHRMVAFAGALVAILAAMAWGSNFCRKRLEDKEKVIPIKFVFPKACYNTRSSVFAHSLFEIYLVFFLREFELYTRRKLSQFVSRGSHGKTFNTCRPIHLPY